MKEDFIDPDEWWVHDLREFCRNFDWKESQAVFLKVGSRELDPKLKKVIAEAVSNFHKTPQARKQYERIKKPCTVDGVTIFDSVSELRKALGQGKKGTRHPNFRLVKRD